MAAERALLDVQDLRVSFGEGPRARPALDGVSFSVRPGKTLAIVGESGCGKSLTALSIMRLLPTPPARITGGRILFDRGDGPALDLASADRRTMRRLRGKDIAMIFQEPMTALDPVYPIGDQIGEVLVEHEGLSRKDALARAVELLRLVGVPSPEERARQYPHEFSGGMRQRAVIAIALACEPALLIADEPTTALDVTVQAQVLRLMRDIQQRFASSILFITHDMGVVGQMADEVVVMYLGQVVEEGPVSAVLSRPAHPYSQGLIASIPTLDMPRDRVLQPISGMVPPIGSITTGCRFRTRCPHAMEICRRDPPKVTTPAGNSASCWLVEEST
ncbi:ABC transporter ATP-binding protein [Alsobacter sp. SYSU M60028]|uniref:ABC transporter ATP-binding protein n=1 Tax=Alsobacter ponti TaxID=2962936 RepID=A0ABT1L9S1_9HYPH|nr:ABC transporter ATP-binding protein [Alsobacter ponti]MCP8938245.1 ABC transporter ATP-binding protein [Alsobacter ponti]